MKKGGHGRPAPAPPTVTPCVQQSRQNWLAENFFLVTVARPSAMAAPVTMRPAAVWYIGSGE